MGSHKPGKTILKKIKVVSVLGARPQFIKAAPVSGLIRKKYRQRIREILVHTGQHYDRNMSDVFFRQMRIPRPRYHLGIGGGTHGAMTGRMLEKIEQVLLKEKPDWVLVYGDTNSTLAGALAAAKLHIPVAHVEAGLRSFNMRMPEEINRILTDHVSQLLFCPTRTAVENLKKEGITRGVVLSGDVMLDAARFYRPIARNISLDRWGLKEKAYVFCTIHRQENTDDLGNLREILKALVEISRQTVVVFAVHPRTRKAIEKVPGIKNLLQSNKENFFSKKSGGKKNETIKTGILVVDPLGYLETQRMVTGAKMVLTDSGGLQKEAYFHRTPCFTLRNETEWLETVATGWNQIVGANEKKIIRAIKNSRSPSLNRTGIYGDGRAAKKIVTPLQTHK
jgi:UDP-N-acetylglucosamine 2-epimerase